MEFNNQLELLRSLQQMANQSESIEIFREQLKVIIWGLEALTKERNETP